MGDEKLHALWSEAHFQVKMCKTHHARSTFGNWNVEKVHVVARSAFPSQNVQSTVEMLKKCAPLWRWRSRTTFGRSDVVSCGRCKGFCTLSKVRKSEGFCGISKNDGRRGTFEEDLERCILRGRPITRDMLIRDIRRSGTDSLREVAFWSIRSSGMLRWCWISPTYDRQIDLHRSLMMNHVQWHMPWRAMMMENVSWLVSREPNQCQRWSPEITIQTERVVMRDVSKDNEIYNTYSIIFIHGIPMPCKMTIYQHHKKVSSFLRLQTQGPHLAEKHPFEFIVLIKKTSKQQTCVTLPQAITSFLEVMLRTSIDMLNPSKEILRDPNQRYRLHALWDAVYWNASNSLYTLRPSVRAL